MTVHDPPTREELYAMILYLAETLNIATDGEWWGGEPESAPQ